jgi:hypothetical protein
MAIPARAHSAADESAPVNMCTETLDDLAAEIDRLARGLRMAQEAGFPDLREALRKSLVEAEAVLTLLVCATDNEERAEVAQLLRRVKEVLA